MKKECDFSMELNFTRTYRDNINEHIAIREARCMQAQFPAVFDEIGESDRIAGRTDWGYVGFSPHNAPTDCGYGYYCHEFKIIEAIENGNIPVDQRDGVMKMLHFWKKETSQNKVRSCFYRKNETNIVQGRIASAPVQLQTNHCQSTISHGRCFCRLPKADEPWDTGNGTGNLGLSR